MYAIIETGGKQVRVSEGDEIKVEKLEVPESREVRFTSVLLIADGENVTVGRPYVENAKVEGKLLGEVKAAKVITFKIKRRKNERRKKGHRQIYSRVKIEKIVK